MFSLWDPSQFSSIAPVSPNSPVWVKKKKKKKTGIPLDTLYNQRTIWESNKRACRECTFPNDQVELSTPFPYP